MKTILVVISLILLMSVTALAKTPCDMLGDFGYNAQYGRNIGIPMSLAIQYYIDYAKARHFGKQNQNALLALVIMIYTEPPVKPEERRAQLFNICQKRIMHLAPT